MKKVKPVSADSGKALNKIDRRRFIGTLTTATVGVSIVPAHVLGGPAHIAPSDKINVAYIGLGTQGLRQLPAIARTSRSTGDSRMRPAAKSTWLSRLGPNLPARSDA